MVESVDPENILKTLQARKLPEVYVELPRSKRTVEIMTLLRQERLWTGHVPESFLSVPNKPVLELDGQPIWAEFIVLRLLERGGWTGAWVKNWGARAFWRDAEQTVELSSAAQALFGQIEKRIAGRGGGCWDIIAACGDNVLFIESKRRGRDRLRETQRIWIESALEMGVPLSCFVIAEWSIAAPDSP